MPHRDGIKAVLSHEVSNAPANRSIAWIQDIGVNAL